VVTTGSRLGGDGELKLREAVLKFRGSKKEGSEVVEKVGWDGVTVGSKGSAVSRLRDAQES
jgi:hypothetical protein